MNGSLEKIGVFDFANGYSSDKTVKNYKMKFKKDQNEKNTVMGAMHISCN
jgi:hypothetical protein